MLSILIPTYNCSCLRLVKELSHQIDSIGIVAEIVVVDDASTDTAVLFENEQISNVSHCRYVRLDSRIDISHMRNRLLQESRFKWLLCLDADVYPTNSDFLKRYIDVVGKADVVCGGLAYRLDGPTTISPLRYRYGISHEVVSLEKRIEFPYKSFKTSNYLVDSDIVRCVMFDESFVGYGHEDTLFGKRLEQSGKTILHIQNPVYHDDTDTVEQFLIKTRKGMDNLYSHSSELEQYSPLLSIYKILKKWHLNRIFALMFRCFRYIFEQNLKGQNPSMKVFALYKLGYLCSIR